MSVNLAGRILQTASIPTTSTLSDREALLHFKLDTKRRVIHASQRRLQLCNLYAKGILTLNILSQVAEVLVLRATLSLLGFGGFIAMLTASHVALAASIYHAPKCKTPRKAYSIEVTYQVTPKCGIANLNFPQRSKRRVRKHVSCRLPAFVKVNPPELPLETVERRQKRPDQYHLRALRVQFGGEEVILTCYTNKEDVPTGYRLTTTTGEVIAEQIQSVDELPIQTRTQSMIFAQ